MQIAEIYQLRPYCFHMKALIFILLCAIGGFYAYKHFAGESVPAPTLAPTPTSTPMPAPRLAPPGVFFTTERFSEKTEFGVHGLKAGSELKLISKDETTARVSDVNGSEFNVPLEILTNDLDVRDTVLKKTAEQLPRGPSTDPREVARKGRIAELRTEIERQNLRIDELELSLKRAKEDLDKEKAKGTAISGSPLQGEQAAKRKIDQIEEQLKISQRKIEDTALAIRKLEFNDQPLPLKPPRLGSPPF